MSLLMQALKKAEQIKRKQSGIGAEETFTLSPKESTAESEIVEKVEPAEVREIAAEQHHFASPGANFTLSPHMEDKPAEIGSGELELTHDVQHSAAVTQQVTSVQEDFTPHQSIVSPSFDASTKEEKTAANQFEETQAKYGKQDAGIAEQKSFSQAVMPKIGAEQKQFAEQAEKLVLSEQKKAKTVFSAKAPQTNQRRIRIGIYASLSLLTVALFAYFYWQSMSIGLNSSLVRTPPPLPVTAIVPAPAPDAEASASIASPAIAQSGVTSNPSPANAALSATQPTNATIPAQSNSAPASPRETTVANASKLENQDQAYASTATSSTVSKAKATTTPIDESKAIQIKRNSGGNQVNPGLSSAYQSFITGDAAAAKLQYQKVLQQEPNNRDALLGMAAIALNQRQAEQAGAFYGRLLELDPGDPDAIAGLTSLQQGDPAQSESRLKKTLSQNPQAGAVLFALGNLYAQQSRWSDAQQTYFRAYTTTPSSADYAFNLAVSLDKLNQVKLAREYYQKALKLAQNSSGNFSRADVEKRITELEAITHE